MSDNPKTINSQDDDQRDAQLNLEINEKQKEVIEKGFYTSLSTYIQN